MLRSTILKSPPALETSTAFILDMFRLPRELCANARSVGCSGSWPDTCRVACNLQAGGKGPYTGTPAATAPRVGSPQTATLPATIEEKFPAESRAGCANRPGEATP